MKGYTQEEIAEKVGVTRQAGIKGTAVYSTTDRYIEKEWIYKECFGRC